MTELILFVGTVAILAVRAEQRDRARKRAHQQLRLLFGITYPTSTYLTDDYIVQQLLNDVDRLEGIYEQAVASREHQLSLAKTMRRFKL